MITPKEAFDMVKSKVDNFIGDMVYDYGPYYVVSNSPALCLSETGRGCPVLPRHPGTALHMNWI